MLEGHVLRELLTPDIKTTQFFTLHEIFHGVTAPGFLFGAGFTFAIATQRRWDEAIAFTRGLFRRTWRTILLILIGYALHFPFLSLQKTITTASSAQWNTFLMFDVLQCMGICLLLMRFLLVMLRQEKLFVITLSVLLLTIVYTTPLFWTTKVNQYLPLFVSTAINGLTGSPFPLFPFAGFLLAGTCVSWLFLRTTQDEREEKFIRWLIIAGLVLIMGSILLEELPFQMYSNYNFWSNSPNYFWLRLGILLLMLGLLWYIEDFFAVHSGSMALMPKWLAMLGMQSLFVYIAHLLILCGWVTNVTFNLRWWWGGTLNINEAILVFIGLTLLMIPASFAWRYLKKYHPVLMRGIFVWMGFCVTWSFYFNHY